MYQMLKLSAKDFRMVIIKMFQQSITNFPEKNENKSISAKKLKL